ncbi:MAG TPA: SpoIIE family protein phosphatase [Pseudonocardiaceae bacterium]|nr:SpoIIE family protein phosphatase [Pseudonocardiaceae bacterium]
MSIGADVSRPAPLHVLLVEDDEGDAVLVRELLTDAAAPVELVWARSLSEAQQQLRAEMDCVLLDLRLPDADGLSGLRQLLARGAATVVVLTGLDDQEQGVAAVGAGAQDYLVKGRIDGRSLERVIRYAVQRHRAEVVARELSEAKLLAAENARLSRGLLPAPLITDPAVGHAAQYRPGGGRMLLGGDFYDVVQAADKSVWAVIGDVCGHGPDEAALGVCLRIAWRTLVLAEHPERDILPTLAQLMIHERHLPRLFTTACMVRITPDRDRAHVWSAGHPLPLLLDGGELREEHKEDAIRAEPAWRELAAPRGLPMGVDPASIWSSAEIELRSRWMLLLYTDGLIEGRSGHAGQRLWVRGLLDLLDTQRTVPGQDPQRLVDGLVETVRQRDPKHDDDIAVVMLTHPSHRPEHDGG